MWNYLKGGGGEGGGGGGGGGGEAIRIVPLCHAYFPRSGVVVGVAKLSG